MGEKKYRNAGTELRQLVRVNRGGAIATDRISVDGCRVGYMERQAKTREEDSGWLFTAGDEDKDYMRDGSKLMVFDLNCIANFDRDVVPLLDATVGSAFARRTPDGPLERVQDGEPSRFPVVSGHHRMTDDWSVTLPGEFLRRIEDGSLVLWRPAHTIWTIVWGLAPGLSASEQAERLIEQCSADGEHLEVRETGGLRQISYRVDDEKEMGVVHALYGFVVGEHGYVQMAQYLDIPEDLVVAGGILNSLREGDPVRSDGC